MRLLRPLILTLLLLGLAGPAAAHSLRLFARVIGAEVSGYGFFIGGGRPIGAGWSAEAAGTRLAEGQTGPDGSFRFTLAAPPTGPVTIRLDTGDGHATELVLPAERFAGGAAPAAPSPATATAGPTAATAAPAPAPVLTPADIEAAVARQVAPLLERIEQMDQRLRLTDLIAGLCLILGLAGIALWARGTRR